MRCKVKGCNNKQWQRPSGLPSVLCDNHAQQVANAIPALLSNQYLVKVIDEARK